MKMNLGVYTGKETGVYKILNLINNKVYIGSTSMNFLKRWLHHTNRLRCHKHKNSHLLHAWDKYSEDNFEFSILELCSKDECEIREQYWIDNYQSYLRINGYNINPLATGIMHTKDVYEKRRQTMLKKYANGELDHVKDMLRKRIPWNKGKKLESTTHLKVKKQNFSNFYFESLALRVESIRSSYKRVYVYDKNMNFLGMWRSSIDLQDWSLTDDNNLPMIYRSTNAKSKKWGIKVLKSSNIQTACKYNTLYKGLYFSNKPLHQVIDVEKLDKNGEG